MRTAGWCRCRRTPRPARRVRARRGGRAGCSSQDSWCFPVAASAYEAVADAGLGEEMTRLCRIGFELLAQAADVDAQVMAALDKGRPPHLAQQMTVRHDLAGV